MDLDTPASVDLSTPKLDTRQLLNTVSNYIPSYTSLMNVIPDKEKVDYLLSKAVDGELVRYTGVRSRVVKTGVKPANNFLGKLLGKKPIIQEDVTRKEVEGIIWYRSGEVGSEATKGQLYQLEFDGTFHEHLDNLLKHPKTKDLFKHPEVPVVLLKGFLGSAGTEEVSIMVDLLKEESRSEWQVDARAFNWLSERVLKCKYKSNGDGVHIVNMPGYDVYLEKAEKGYKLIDIDTSRLEELYGNSYTPYVTEASLTERRYQTETLLNIPAGGYTFLNGKSLCAADEKLGITHAQEFIVAIPKEGQSLLVGCILPNDRGQVELDNLKVVVPDLVKLLSLPELQGLEQAAFDRIIKLPEGYKMVQGVYTILTAPVSKRTVLESKTASDMNSRTAKAPFIADAQAHIGWSLLQEKWDLSFAARTLEQQSDPKSTKRLGSGGIVQSEPWYRFSNAMNLAETAYNIGKNDPNAEGVTIKQGNNIKNRCYLKWTVERGFYLKSGSSNNTQRVITANTPSEVFMQYRRYLGTYSPLPDFVKSSEVSTVKALFDVLIDNPTGKQFPLLSKWAQICGMHGGTRVLIGNAVTVDERVYANRNRDGELFLNYGSGQAYTKMGTTYTALQGVLSETNIEINNVPDLATRAGLELTSLLKAGMELNDALEVIRTLFIADK